MKETSTTNSNLLFKISLFFGSNLELGVVAESWKAKLGRWLLAEANLMAPISQYQRPERGYRQPTSTIPLLSHRLYVILLRRLQYIRFYQLDLVLQGEHPHAFVLMLQTQTCKKRTKLAPILQVKIYKTYLPQDGVLRLHIQFHLRGEQHPEHGLLTFRLHNHFNCQAR